MILVTGSMRSGTSMWMQILKGAGCPILGQPFPADWATDLRDLNPHGFYENKFRHGIYYRTNPDPSTGRFLHPEMVAAHGVKVFIPGLVRTDYAFIGKVLATIRPWRAYARSIERLREVEARRRSSGREHGLAQRGIPQPRRRLPPDQLWLLETFELLRDAATRRYPMRVVAFDAVIDDPRRVVPPALEWLGLNCTEAGLEAALQAVRPSLRRSTAMTGGRPSDERARSRIRVMDDVYDCLRQRGRLTPGLTRDLNRAWTRVVQDIEAKEVEGTAVSRVSAGTAESRSCGRLRGP